MLVQPHTHTHSHEPDVVCRRIAKKTAACVCNIVFISQLEQEDVVVCVWITQPKLQNPKCVCPNIAVYICLFEDRDSHTQRDDGTGFNLSLTTFWS